MKHDLGKVIASVRGKDQTSKIVVDEKDSAKILKFMQDLEQAHQEEAKKKEEERMRRVREDEERRKKEHTDKARMMDERI